MDKTVTMLERLAAAPKPFVCVVTYADGRKREIAQPRRIQAERIAERESRKIGRRLIDPMTGETVRVVSAHVEERSLCSA